MAEEHLVSTVFTSTFVYQRNTHNLFLSSFLRTPLEVSLVKRVFVFAQFCCLVWLIRRREAKPHTIQQPGSTRWKHSTTVLLQNPSMHSFELRKIQRSTYFEVQMLGQVFGPLFLPLNPIIRGQTRSQYFEVMLHFHRYKKHPDRPLHYFGTLRSGDW